MTDRNNAEPATRLLAVAGTLANNGVRQGEMGLAALYVVGSVGLALVGVFAGLAIMRALA